MSEIAHDAGFVEVADRCWVVRHEYLDVNVGVVGGERGLVVVDTGVSEAAARTVLADLRRFARGDVVAVVNTHEHFDHTFGNAVLRDEYVDVAIHAHETAAANLTEAGERAKQMYAGDPDDPHGPDVLASRIVVPDATFSSVAVIDLGDRVVEVLHPGRGHTAGDAVVRVGDADIMYAGDLVEESALRHGVPGFGPDCYPMEWPASLDLVVGMLGEQTVVVPGHGACVDRDFVQEQRAAIGVVAETIRDLASRGVPVTEALLATQWPYPREELVHAVARGYEHLPRGTRSLPLL